MLITKLSFLVGLLTTFSQARPQIHPRQGSLIVRNVPTVYGRSDGRNGPVTPKVLILATYFDEANIWPAGMPELYNLNVTVPGLTPNYPIVHCTSSDGICLMVTGLHLINAAVTMMAMAYSDLFDLKKSYVMVAGIAGGNPEHTSTGSVTFARYVVQGDLQFELANPLPPNWGSSSGYFPLGTRRPNVYPGSILGTEVFEVSAALRHRAATVARRAKLNDTIASKRYRERYMQTAARQHPGVQECDTLATNLYWAGKGIADAMGNYVTRLTNGTGVYCSTESEDSGWIAGLFRAYVVGRVDYTRTIVMRSITNYDRPPPGVSDYDNLFSTQQSEGSYAIGLQNLYLAGKEVIEDIINHWHSTFELGIPTNNYMGDIFNTFNDPRIDIG
ncbi:hypothetical protein AA313_de0210245 [Arthrobotrys entomopaga]|nr:hypothetical protein AA313_de0210245 [Arthrobotrys entomopaga]